LIGVIGISFPANIYAGNENSSWLSRCFAQVTSPSEQLRAELPNFNLPPKAPQSLLLTLRSLSYTPPMNSRDVLLVSTATIFGALSSALALRFFFSSKPKLSQICSSSANGEAAAQKRSAHSPFDPSKRKWYLSWDDYFMAIAFLSAERSKDPNRQALVTMDFPEAVQMTNSHGRRLKSKNGDPLETKYPYVCHAEVNAILNTNHASAAGQRLYVTMFPCNECAKIIIQSGVSEVIYFVEKNSSNTDVAYTASRKLLSMANVKVRKLQPQMDQILIKFEDPR
ncbi:unnamed protein product, partial [Linum tenue]